MSDERRLKEIRARVDRAAFGPWEAVKLPRNRCDGILYWEDDPKTYQCDCCEFPQSCKPSRYELVSTDSGIYGPDWDSADFIAHSREDVPWLLDLVERLKARAGQ